MRIASALVAILGFGTSVPSRIHFIVGAGIASATRVAAATTRAQPDAIDFQTVDGSGGETLLGLDDVGSTGLDHGSAVEHGDDAVTIPSHVSTCRANGGEYCPSSTGGDDPRRRIASSDSDDVETLGVETGTQDGISIEFVGTATGTIPGPIPQSQRLPQQNMHEKVQQHQEVQPQQMRGVDHEAEEQDIESRQEREIEGFERLQCMNWDTSLEGSHSTGRLTIAGISENMLRKLMYSAKQQDEGRAEGTSDPAGRDSTAGDSDGALASAGSTGGAASLAQRYLAILTIPAWYLFGFLGSVPGWFSEVVFTVSLRDGAEKGELPQRLLLVQTPPRFVQIACAVLSPLLSSPPPPPPPPPPSSSSSSFSSGSASWLEQLARDACQLDSPFPGKSVSRPCLTSESRVLPWLGAGVGNIRSLFGASGGTQHGGDSVERSGGSWCGACRCVSEGVAPCTVRAVPGRDPCLYLEVDGFQETGRRRRSEGRDSDGAVATAESSVDLPTYTLAFAKEGSPSREHRESSGSRTRATGMETLDPWRTVAAGHGLPSSVTVPTYVARLAVGAAFLFLARPLSESRLFHYVLSAFLGGVFAAMMLVFRVLFNPQQALFRVMFLGGLLVWAFLAVGGNFVPSPASVALGLPGNMMAFWNDGFGGFAWAGKVFYVVSALVGMVMTRWQGLFLDEADSWLNGQASIRRLLMVSGAYLIFSGVSDPEIGSVLVIIALSVPAVAHCFRRYDMWTKRSRWYRAGPKLSQSEYERQGDEYTRRALEELQNSVGGDWRNVRKQVKPSTRNRMAAFVRTGEHYGEDKDEAEDRHGWRSSCILQ